MAAVEDAFQESSFLPEIIPAPNVFPSDREGRHQDMAPGIRLVRLETASHWARGDALWPITFGLACCSVEMLAARNTPLEMARFGDEIFRMGPRHADLMILSGHVNGRMAHYIQGLRERMVAPGWVIGIGDCFRESTVRCGVPVDVHVDGCPPSARDLFEAIEELERRARGADVTIMKNRPWVGKEDGVPRTA